MCVCALVSRTKGTSMLLVPWTGRPGLSAATVVLFLAVALHRTEQSEACGPGRGGGRRRTPRKLTPLVFKQHVPNVSENTLGASGLTEGKLTRDHSKFKELVPNYNADIVFKDEEGTGADRLMTQRCKEKLNTLAISVMNQWPGVKLRVTEGFDEDGLHASDSLHYEGRAVDITTSDRDRSKYGMLARLAVEAGFDWVYYESRSHIHCSVKSESADAARSGGCFHSKGLVETPTGLMQMSEVKVGDKVLVVDSSGSFCYSEVVMFLDRDVVETRLYYTLETDRGTRITLTPSHLIYTTDNDRTLDINEGFVTFAQNIEPGNYIYTSASYFNTSTPDDPHFRSSIVEKVMSVSVSSEVGVFAPLTREGTIVVNNVVSSCYAVFNQQFLAHWAFLPIRILENFKQAFLHLLYNLHLMQYKKVNTVSNQKGIHWYAKFLYMAAHNLLPDRWLYQ